MSLFWRVFAINTAVLVGAVVLLIWSPATISPDVTAEEVAVLAAGVALVLLLNLVLLRRTFEPLQRLVATMGKVDPLTPGRRATSEQRSIPEVDAVMSAFNDMLERLEGERRESGRRALNAQEAERRRLARELHDQLGQTLTGVVLQLETLSRTAPEALRPLLLDLRETVRAGVEQTRGIAAGLRPEALDDFGLRTALVTLTTQVTEHSGLRVTRRLAGDLPALSDDEGLVVYRVAQESLTNAARHAGASSVEVALAREGGDLVLRVRDDGAGVTATALAGDGTGVRGMRERAILVGGRLEISGVQPSGTEVRLSIPLHGR